MLTSQMVRHEELRNTLARLTRGTSQTSLGVSSVDVDLVVTPNEVNDRHGTGVLVKRVFTGRSVVSIRSRDHYGGEHQFGKTSLVLSHQDVARAEAFRQVLGSLEGFAVRRVACIPYLSDDLVTAIAAKEASGAPLAIWIMDDQNVAVDAIPDALMREALEKSSLRLTTHPEMREAYEKKFGLRFWLLPAVVPGALVTTRPAPGAKGGTAPGALVGSLWARDWFERLCRTVGSSGHRVDWYGNHESPCLRIGLDELEAAGIRAHGIVSEAALAEALRTRAFAIVPTGTLDGDAGSARALAGLSLPGRILFVAATSNTPVIVLGSERTPAARFVRRFGIGLAVPYEPEAFRQAVAEITRPEVQASMRRNAVRIAPTLSAEGMGDWVWGSLEKGEAVDDRFESLLPRGEDDLAAYIDPPAPSDVHREYVPAYRALRRLRSRGVRPDFVVEVGASRGIWSYAASRVFPEARFVLVDPLASRYDRRARQYHADRVPRSEIVEAAVSNHVGRTVFNVSPDLYGASLLRPVDFRRYETVEVPVTTVDALVRERGLEGRGLLKADVQCAEHLVLEGARESLARFDAVVLELSLGRYHPEARTFAEMVGVLEGLGFRYFDDAGVWRSPVDGMLLQKDAVFVRRELCALPMGNDGSLDTGGSQG